jgi:phage shock protein C
MMKKKLYKSTKDRKIAGVCGGIAEYMNVDSTVVRLICIALVFGWGTGLLAYIVAAIIMPVK